MRPRLPGGLPLRIGRVGLLKFQQLEPHPSFLTRAASKWIRDRAGGSVCFRRRVSEYPHLVGRRLIVQPLREAELDASACPALTRILPGRLVGFDVLDDRPCDSPSNRDEDRVGVVGGQVEFAIAGGHGLSHVSPQGIELGSDLSPRQGRREGEERESSRFDTRRIMEVTSSD